MTNADKEREVTIISGDTFWSRACGEALEGKGIKKLLRDPNTPLPKEDPITGKLFIIPIPRIGSDHWDLVQQISEQGGKSIVMAATEFESLSFECMRFARTVCLRRTFDFALLAELVDKMLT